MRKAILFAPLGLLLLGACSVTAETPTSNAVLGAAPGYQATRQSERVQFSARIVDRTHRCNTIRSSSSGRLYSVQQSDLRNYRTGTRVRVRGWLAGRNSCPYPLIRVNRVRQI